MTAEEIFSRCSNDILYPMLTNTNSSGSSGAPSQPAQFRSLTISKMFARHACMAPFYKKNTNYMLMWKFKMNQNCEGQHGSKETSY
jgi:hypothetical protein